MYKHTFIKTHISYAVAIILNNLLSIRSIKNLKITAFILLSCVHSLMHFLSVDLSF